MPNARANQNPAREQPREGGLGADLWNSRAPNLDDFEALAAAEYGALPAEFRALCRDLVVRVEEFPDDEILRHFGTDDPFALLGLFQGVGLPFQSVADSGRMPNMVSLYRRPILEYWAAHEETLGAVVRHVLIHEIGHHFGFSDADMDAIEASAGEA